MPKSKLRGGVKAHRKRIKARNERIAIEVKKRKKLMQEMFMKQLEEMKLQMSGDTNTAETVNLNTDGFVQSAEII
jgi:hypothetical protein